MQSVVGLLSALLVLLAGVSRADVVPDVYRGEAIVTGKENLEERQRGFREAFADAIVKVSADARLACDPRLAPALAEPQRFVVNFEYEDRLAKKKLMDEQGTRERSYILRVDFDPAAVDRLLTVLNARPWPADRPRLLVLLAVRDTMGTYLLGTDSARGWGQREALAAISRRRGVPAVLPHTDLPEQGGVGLAEAEHSDRAAIAQIAASYGASAVLQGRMVLREDGLWDTSWTFQDDKEAGGTWRSDGTTFDRSIAAGIEGSALRLARKE